jgi:hypothetical protein
MTVKELRQKLSKIDDKTDVVVYWEEGKEHQYFEIDDVSLHSGTPQRHPSGNVGFRFETKGPATWLFISVSPA